MTVPTASSPDTCPTDSHAADSVEAFRQALIDNLYYQAGQAVQSAKSTDVHRALCHTVRDLLVERWRETSDAFFEQKPKVVYYLSAEYLLGRQLPQNLFYTDTTDLARQACESLGFDFAEVLSHDPEPGLGNGGLGRLAACYLDSLATLEVPAVGYGIRYEFGIFRQSFEDGHQVENADHWLRLGNPWEFSQPDKKVDVGFGGRTHYVGDGDGGYRVSWTPAETVLGEPYHVLVPGYGKKTVNLLRLWRARSDQKLDFRHFDAGDYIRAVERKVGSENLSKVLYPNDSTPQGKELRFRQQYFLVACSLHDILRRFRLLYEDWNLLPEKVVIQLNDTHPVLAIPELMRVLLDTEGMEWDQAWDLTQRTFAYTCHTLLPEALERWPVELFGQQLPRHLEIVEEIDRRFRRELADRYAGQRRQQERMAIIDRPSGGHGEAHVRMANLATVGSHAVNGVAELHSRLLRQETLPGLARHWPERFHNVTNGVTPRRFMAMANPQLKGLISSRIGDGWLNDLERLQELEKHIDDPDLARSFRGIKRQHKVVLANEIARKCGVKVPVDSLFDCLVKRLHEYKRQLLQVLHIITLYHRLKDDPGLDLLPRTFVFGAKAAPGYFMAKRIIKLINDVASVVNADTDVDGRLNIAFLPNFDVSLAQRIYPAAELSEQISMAGKEASGTGNMKFALNGALTIGTLDGANIEIRERVGPDNFFLFGLTAEEVKARKEEGYDPRVMIEQQPELKRALEAIADGDFSNGDTRIFRPIIDSLIDYDDFLLLADYASYMECQERVSEAFRQPESWTRMALLNIARCGFFSSDRSIRQYCERIWHTEPLPIP